VFQASKTQNELISLIIVHLSVLILFAKLKN